MEFELTSSAFNDGEPIPARYCCDGEDTSPPLAWRGTPEGVKSFALIMDDPDAPVGTWVHWVLYDLPPDAEELAEGIPAVERLPSGGGHGRNSWRRFGYGGPCPPGGTHRYFFKLYALDRQLEIEPGAKKKNVEAHMTGHILGEAVLMGTYKRQR